MLRIYFAAPLFSEAERSFNRDVVSSLEPDCDVYLPQRDGSLIIDLLERGVPRNEAVSTIFRQDFEALRDCDLVLAVLDGRSVDEGVAVELGLAYGLGKPCWGLKTDFRSLSHFGDNPMIEALLARKFGSVVEMSEELAVLLEDHSLS